MTTPAQRAGARRTVAYLRRQAGFDQPRLPPLDELLALGDAYLAEVGDGSEDSMRRTLGQTGQVYVTLAAAREYATVEDAGIEEARRELTELLLAAKESASEPGLWRFRRRSEGLDVTARVVQERELLVVTSVSVRDY